MVTSAQDYFELDSTRRYGRDLSRHLWWLLLALLISEVLLQQFFSRDVNRTKPQPVGGSSLSAKRV